MTNPCSDKVVKMLFEGASRILAKSLNKNEHITPNNYTKGVVIEKKTCLICLIYILDFCLSLGIRDRELCDIKTPDINLLTRAEIRIRRLKTGVYRRDNTAFSKILIIDVSCSMV